MQGGTGMKKTLTSPFLGLTAVIGVPFPHLLSRCFSTSFTPGKENKENKIAVNKSELLLTLDNGDLHTSVLCVTSELRAPLLLRRMLRFLYNIYI